MTGSALKYFVLAAALLSGCKASGPRLAFPARPLERTEHVVAYDVDRDGAADFRLRIGVDARFNVLCYDDDADGDDDRIYRLSDYDNDRVPHLIILLDSVPFEQLVQRHKDGRWTWFDPPQKVIPPFPTMSGVIFSRMLHAPPQGGMINRYFDRSRGRPVNRISERARGAKNPWEERLHYRLGYIENGLSFLEPRSWFHVELERARKAFDQSPDRVTIVYLASTAGMLSKHGVEGLEEVLDGLQQLCLSVLHARSGAVKITVVSDHGHRLGDGARIDLEQLLGDSGFRPGSRLVDKDSVVLELDGLVNYAGMHTRQPARVAQALLSHAEIELATYLEGDRVIVAGRSGRASIERRGDGLRYAPIDADVLDYQTVLEALDAAGQLDTDGFADDRDWFGATIDHRWPDAPARLWDAFHGLAINTPDLMITTAPGYYVGLSSMQFFINMASTHGGLDQQDSATFVMSMTGRAVAPMRTEDVLPIVEPAFNAERKPR